MMNEVILGTPKPQPRVKAVRRGAHVGVYTPSSADEWRDTIKLALNRHAGKNIEGAFAVKLSFFLPRPKSHFRSGKFSHLLKESAPEFHTKKPDCDNLAKLVLDVMTKIAYFKDDSQVALLYVTKAYASDLEDEGVKIESAVM
jgi:crossover junction endodeoxyribonuclease RusA